MKVLHLSNDLDPHVTGGTEIFIRELISAQQALPDPPQLLWAAHAGASFSGDHDPQAPLATHQRLLPPVVPSSDRLAAVGHRAAAIPGFGELLEDFQPDLVHLHSLSPRCGLSHARAVRNAGARLVLTVHAPGFTCMQGSLLRHRRKLCDGRIDLRRCTACRLENGRLPAPLAALLALQNGWPLSPQRPGRLAHALTARRLTGAYAEAWHELSHLADGIHVLADWSRQVLLRNGTAADKVRLIRTGGPPSLPPRRRIPLADGVLRLVYWGRCAEVKGLHLVIDAIRSLPPTLPIQLDFYGPYWNDDYGRAMQRRIAGDERFRLRGPLPHEQLLPRLQSYDLAVIPSTWLETGPLTVLEAFAAGLPVAGSDLGGISELLGQQPGGGWLLPLKPAAWARLLQNLLNDPAALALAVPQPRGFAAVAAELQMLYTHLNAGGNA